MKYALFHFLLLLFLLHSIGTYINMLIKIPSPAKEQPHDEPVNHMKSLMNNARGNNRPFPTIANSTVFTESPLMLEGVKKFVHICATGPHMNKRVAVQADTLPMYKTTFSGSLPIRACTPKQKNHKIHQHSNSSLPTSQGNDTMSYEMGRQKNCR